MNQEKNAPTQKGRKVSRSLIVLFAALVVAVAFIVAQQIGQVRRTMDEAAYQNMEMLMRTVSGTISSAFASDEEYMKSLASTVSLAEDASEWISTVAYDKTKVQNIYFAAPDEDTAYGKNGETIALPDHVFTEYKNGQTRSGAYMTRYGNYVYLLKEPVRQNGVLAGYLYGEFPMSRFYDSIPKNVVDANEISLLEASTLNYIQIPSHNGAGTHIGFNSLKYYLDDPQLAAQIVDEIETAIKNGQYYMRMLTFSRSQNNVMSDVEYVVFLWPIDEGEYYLSGFSRVENLQSERISALSTINAMVFLLVSVSALVLLLLAAFFVRIVSESRKNVLIQQKHNRELDDALNIAKVANQSKSNFLSNMSHDIRTPMNAIVGYTTLINKEADDPEKVREYTRKISGAGDYLLSLINDVLDMSKIESGKTTLTISQFRIGEMVSEVESIIRMQAEKNHQTFIVSVKDVKHDSVMGDKLRIRQIILNLLGNALKYTQAGGEIHFTLQGVEQPKETIQKLHIVVQDNGYGMDAAFQKTIFEPFTRLNNSMTGKIEGTGLGLAITKNIVDLMGGTIAVTSAPGKGSTFTVELELPAAKEEESRKNEDSGSDEENFSLEGLHILAAEDNELNAEILTELLQMEKASCVICEDGRKAVEAFEKSAPGTYDLILMDIQMPNMNGYEAAKAIRGGSHPEAGTIPIVAMTANAFAEDVMDAMQAGMNGHVAKPVDMSVLKKTLCKVLTNRKKDEEQ